MAQQDVTPSDETATSTAASELKRVRSQLYARYGYGAIRQAADELGIDRPRVSALLSERAQEIVAGLDRLAEGGDE